MSNIHDRRYLRNRPDDKPQEWQYACVPGKFKAGQIKASIDVGGYYVVLVSRNPIETRNGQPARYETLRFRGSNPQELKEKILKEFPDAIFTPANPEPEPDLKTQHAAQVRQEKQQQAAIAEQRQFDGLVVAEHRKIERTLTRAQQLEAANQSINLFINDVAYSSPQWVAWFRQHSEFLSYPDNSSKNRDTLLKFCESRGQLVPRTDEIAEAMNYLLSHGHFYTQPSYKRSEQDEFAAVQPFVREIKPSETITDNDVRRIVERLTAKFGLPVSVSIERLRAVGIPENRLESVFTRLRQINTPDPTVKKQSSAELKSGLQDMRNAARGNKPRNRRVNLSGY